MKKIIFLVLFVILLSAPVYANFHFNAEYGNAIEQSNLYFSKIGIGYRFSFFGILSDTTYNYINWSTRFDYIHGAPFQDIYIAQQKFKYGIFFLKAQHYCCHPVCSKNNSYQSKPVGNDFWYGQISTISIGIEYELP